MIKYIMSLFIKKPKTKTIWVEFRGHDYAVPIEVEVD